ncbi:tyrosine-type recombinase/integrase [Streptomyces sp. NPDC096153]|uniref:tyrosine-type recombinase/integrase n=1 Tax=Streptomyces sp. NPDC096153 TaxID=3155548 RepID=UPI003327DC52
MPETEPVAPECLEQLLADESIPVVHRALWALLWDGELRLNELLSVDVRDVDFAARMIRVDYPVRSRRSPLVPFGDRAGRLLGEAIGDAVDGPALHRDGRPLGRHEAADRARRAGVAIHGFRLGGQGSRVAV